MVDEVNEFFEGGTFRVVGIVEIQDSNVDRGEFIVIDVIVLFRKDLDDILFGFGSVCTDGFEKGEVDGFSKYMWLGRDKGNFETPKIGLKNMCRPCPKIRYFSFRTQPNKILHSWQLSRVRGSLKKSAWRHRCQQKDYN